MAEPLSIAEHMCDVSWSVKLSTFDNRIDKIGLALMSAVEAKGDSVKEYGIGEDLAINLFCGRENKLRAMLQLRHKVQNLNQMDRFNAVMSALSITRRGWGVDAISLVSEGYVSIDPDATAGLNLKDEFINPKSNIRECITVAHLEDGHVTFIVKPYRYDVPRLVVWDEEWYHPGSSMVRNQDGMYPNMMHRIVTEVEADIIDDAIDVEVFDNVLIEGLYEAGFYCQLFY